MADLTDPIDVGFEWPSAPRRGRSSEDYLMYLDDLEREAPWDTGPPDLGGYEADRAADRAQGKL